MNKEDLARLCDARDTLCEFCEVENCEECVVTQIISDAANESESNDSVSYTAYLYRDDGITSEDLATYDDKEEAINFAKSRDWDEVVDDNSGGVVWCR